MESKMLVKFKSEDEAFAKVNTLQLSRGSEKAAGFDICSNQDVIIEGKKSAIITTGLQVKLPEGTVGLIWARSGLSAKDGIDIGAGVVDNDYIGEIKVVVRNTSTVPFKVTAGMRIAQLLVQPIITPSLMYVDSLDATDRGANGFGSTGV